MSGKISGLCSGVESGRRDSVTDVTQFLTSPKPTSVVADEVEVENTTSIPIPPEKTDNQENQDQPPQRSSKINQEQHSSEDEIKRVFGTNGFDPYVMVKAPPRKPWHEWTIKEDFEVGKPLGHGLYGHVYLARTKIDKRIVALKVMHEKDIMFHKAEAVVNREVEIHCKLRHENVIKMYGFFRDVDKIVLVLELAAGGDVFTDLNSQPHSRYKETKAATYIDQVSNGLQYLHSNGIMHRDIKPENLLLGYFGEIKIADFGWAIKSSGMRECRTTICGTHEYMAPEILNSIPYDEKIDVWCLGVLAYEFLTGNSPFAVQCREEMETRIKAVQLTFPFHVSYQGKDLIQKILCKEPSKRLSLYQIRRHEWIKVYKSREPKKLLSCFDKFKDLEPALIEKYKDAGRILAEKRLQDKKEKAGCSTST